MMDLINMKVQNASQSLTVMAKQHSLFRSPKPEVSGGVINIANVDGRLSVDVSQFMPMNHGEMGMQQRSAPAVGSAPSSGPADIQNRMGSYRQPSLSGINIGQGTQYDMLCRCPKQHPLTGGRI